MLTNSIEVEISLNSSPSEMCFDKKQESKQKKQFYDYVLMKIQLLIENISYDFHQYF